MDGFSFDPTAEPMTIIDCEAAETVGYSCVLIRSATAAEARRYWLFHPFKRLRRRRH